jgi:hypothetical protein
MSRPRETLTSTAAPVVTGRVPDAVRTFGVSRAGLYRLAADHPGLMVKLGRTTLIDFGKMQRIIASLPPAKIGQGRAPE